MRISVKRAGTLAACLWLLWLSALATHASVPWFAPDGLLKYTPTAIHPPAPRVNDLVTFDWSEVRDLITSVTPCSYQINNIVVDAEGPGPVNCEHVMMQGAANLNHVFEHPGEYSLMLTVLYLTPIRVYDPGVNNPPSYVHVCIAYATMTVTGSWKPVVVLVRGFGSGDTQQYWSALEAYLAKDFEVWVCCDVTGQRSVEIEASYLRQFIDEKLEERQCADAVPRSISIVAHSYGGLITRKFLHEYCDSAGRFALDSGEMTKIGKVVMLSGVNCGSLLADLDIIEPWLPVSGNRGAIGCLKRGYVQNVFNVKECPDLHPRAPYYLFGADGGNHGLYLIPWSILSLGPPPPPIAVNDNDGAVTVRSAHGIRWQWLPPHWEKQVGGYEYTTNDDHSSIIQNVNTLDQVKAILLDRNAPTTQGVLPQLAGESQPTTAVLALNDGSILPGAAAQIPVTLDDCPQVSFSLGYAGDATDFTLTTPTNVTISPTTTDPNVSYTQTSDQGYVHQAYVIDSPEVGEWSANLCCSGGGTAGAQWNFMATAVSELGITGTTDYFQPAGNALLAATVSDGSQPFSGALVYADVRRPDEITDRVYLCDDGAHQDGAAGDGTYASFYTQCTTPGGYNARYTATGANSQGHSFSRTSGSSFQTNPQSATLSGTYSDHGEDTGPPAGIEKIIVDVGVQVIATGKYSVSAKLANSEGAELFAAASESAELAVGTAALSLPFDTEPLRTCGFDGPYKLIDVELWDDSAALALRTDYAASPYVTSEYHRSEFSDNCPPRPVVDLVVKDVDCAGGSVTLGWNAPDSESAPAVSYDIRYAINALDTERWSTATAVANPPAPSAPGSPQTFTISGLSPGDIYCFGIQACDQVGNNSDLSNIAEIYFGAVVVRNAADGTYGGALGTVTASGDGMPGTYIESEDRAWGARVDTSGYQEGDRLYVTGSLQTEDGERVLMWPKVLRIGDGEHIEPLALLSRSLGADGGLAPDCLLVRIWGKVTQVGAGYLYMDDGSGLKDGTSTGAEENVGVRVICDPAGYSSGEKVEVTGISSCFWTPSGIARRILTRGAGDLRKVGE